MTNALSDVNFDILNPPLEPVILPGPVDGDVNTNDVLRGASGAGVNKYRELVGELLATYEGAPKKKLVSRSLVLIIRNRGGRFLIRENGQLMEIGDEKAQEKASLAFQSQLRLKKRDKESAPAEPTAVAPRFRTTSPLDADSDSDTDFDENLLTFVPFSQSSNTSTPENPPPEEEANRAPTPEETNRKLQRRAELNVSFINRYDGLTVPSYLRWQVKYSKTKKKNRIDEVYPCRICHKSEAVGLALPQKWDETKKALVQFLGNVERDKLQLVSLKSLVPYYTDRDESRWRPDFIERYAQQVSKKLAKDPDKECKVLVELLLLEKIMRLSFEKYDRLIKEEQERLREKRALASEEDDQKLMSPRRLPIERDDDDDDDDDEDDFTHHKKEPLRPGDIIEYTNPVFKRGDKQGHRTATVLSVNAKERYKLILDNMDCLPDDTMVRRKQTTYCGKPVDNPSGAYMAISSYKLKTSGSGTMKTAVEKQVKQNQEIFKKNLGSCHERLKREGFAPMDMFNRFGSTLDIVNNNAGPETLVKMPKKRGRHKGSDKKKSCNELSKPTKKPRTIATWAERIQKQIDSLGSAGRRRGASHMSLPQLELALVARRALERKARKSNLSLEEQVSVVSQEIETSERSLKCFLEGDEGRQVGTAVHDDTQECLQEWVDKHSESDTEEDESAAKPNANSAETSSATNTFSKKQANIELAKKVKLKMRIVRGNSSEAFDGCVRDLALEVGWEKEKLREFVCDRWGSDKELPLAVERKLREWLVDECEEV